VTLQGECVSTSASVWRRNGQNILDAPNTSTDALSLQTHAMTGLFLHQALEAYVGPAITLSAQPGLDITLSCQAGITPDSDTLRVRLDVVKLFKHVRFKPKKHASGIQRRSAKDTQALSRRQQSDEILALLDQADEALHRDDLADAVVAWREVLRRNPKNARALHGFREYQDEIFDAVKQLYLDGMQAYVQNDYAGAIEQWQEALRYAPNDAKVQNSIAQTQKKLESIRQIKRQTPTPTTP
jgi:tetratricopeptide (TPR) repeat protein